VALYSPERAPARRRHSPAPFPPKRGQRIPSCWKDRSNRTISTTNATCPTSTPHVEGGITPAAGHAVASPRPASALANPESHAITRIQNAYQPRMPDGQCWSPRPPHAYDFRAEKQNTQGDRGVERQQTAHWRTRTSRSPGVRLCARVNDVTVFSSIQRFPHGQQQTEDEQQVIDAKYNMFHAIHQIRPRHLQHALRSGELDPRAAPAARVPSSGRRSARTPVPARR